MNLKRIHKRCKGVVFNTNNHSKDVVKLDTSELFVSECFKYIGSIFHDNKDINQDVKLMIQ